jgi:hypothetical protein
LQFPGFTDDFALVLARNDGFRVIAFWSIGPQSPVKPLQTQ